MEFVTEQKLFKFVDTLVGQKLPLEAHVNMDFSPERPNYFPTISKIQKEYAEIGLVVTFHYNASYIGDTTKIIVKIA